MRPGRFRKGRREGDLRFGGDIGFTGPCIKDVVIQTFVLNLRSVMDDSLAAACILKRRCLRNALVSVVVMDAQLLERPCSLGKWTKLPFDMYKLTPLPSTIIETTNLPLPSGLSQSCEVSMLTKGGPALGAEPACRRRAPRGCRGQRMRTALGESLRAQCPNRLFEIVAACS